MNVDVALLPRDLPGTGLSERTVVVFDVLRATTTMTAALAAGIKQIHLFPNTAAVLLAAKGSGESPLLCGEERCLPPPGFDLGNSPLAFQHKLHAGRTIFMSTTNGTRALLATRGAAAIFAGALVNASAVAEAARHCGNSVLLLCAGTGGQVALEDILGAGAVMSQLFGRGSFEIASDAALMALRLFEDARSQLPSLLRQTMGGRNIISVGLDADIDFAARLNVVDCVGIVAGEEPVVSVWRA